ncbi:phosphate ABC transporter substrate-binding protein [Bacteroidales bacterium]|nr:phosphate ABC transporter substrate-binding protein [Bacteroidales bacterium]
MKNLFVSIVFIFSFLVFFACNDKPKNLKWQDTPTTGVIPIACDQCFEPIINEEIVVFESIYNQSGIMADYQSEVESIRLLMADSVRLAVVTRKLSEEENAFLVAKNRIVKSIKIAQDGVAVIVHKDNPDSIISVHTLKKILTGEITKWSQINPKSNLGDITVMFDNPNSSTIRFALDSICRGELLSEGLFAQKNNQEVLDRVASIEGSLGIIGVNWVSDDRDTTNMTFMEKIKVMAVSKFPEADYYNSYKPYQAYIALGDYPMVRDVYVLLNDPRGGLSTGFATFLASDRGQRIILKSGLFPATQPVNLVQIKNESIRKR